jgi:hypothetical protein
LTGKREKLLENPFELTGDAFIKKGKGSEKNDNLK